MKKSKKITLHLTTNATQNTQIMQKLLVEAIVRIAGTSVGKN
jgi:hypothetical protein